MLFLLSYLIFLGTATASFSGSTLTVTDQGTIASGDVSNYKDQTQELVISYADNVEIQSSAFNGFTKLTTISIECLQLTIKGNSFDECSSITTLSINTQNLDIMPGVFSSTSSLTVNYKGKFFSVAMAEFITSKIKSLNIDVTNDCAFGLAESSNSYIEELRIQAKTISFVENCFQNAKGIQIIELNASQKVTLDVLAFVNSQIKEINIYAGDSIELFSDCFKGVKGITNVKIESGGTILISSGCFQFAEIKNVDIKSVKDIIFVDKSLQSVTSISKLTIETEGNCEAKMNSFIDSKIQEISIKSGKTTSFEQGSFKKVADLHSLTINSNGDITFGIESFIDSGVNLMHLNSDGAVKFSTESFKNSNQLSSVTINSNNVDIESNAFQDSKSLSKLDVHAKGKVTIRSGAFSGCTSLTEKIIDAKEEDIAPDAFPQNGDKGKKSSSDKDDDGDQSSAKTLGNIDVKTVYLGTSPNIVFNLNFIFSFFRKMRKALGHVVPPPDLIHSAIWVSNDGSVSDESLGALFVYGRYFNKKKSDAYLSDDGAKAYVVTFKQFKEKYPAIEPMKLIPHKNLKLFDFINKVKEVGKWGVNDYNWPTNNCQHFTAKLIDILEATRDIQTNDDWIDLPKQIINSLESNEKK